MGPASLSEWLRYAGTVHAVGVDLGLARVTEVAERLGFRGPERRPAPRTVIVAGTNGKGSTTVAIEALLRAGGLSVGSTLSPHVHRFNERVRLDGAAADDALLVQAFEAVESARADVPLTYFEFSALVALYCFRAAAVDAAVLEVGLGGRLDAFNLVSADVAVITSIGLDHQEYLGDDLDSIGREKAGVLRPAQRAVLGEAVSESVLAQARRLGCRTSRLGRDFHVRQGSDGWAFHGAAGSFTGLPWGGLAPANCALAIEAAGHFVAQQASRVRAALAGLHLPGRFEHWRLDGDVPLVLDVAHNPAGAAFLRGLLEAGHPGRRFVAVLGMLKDKDVAGVASALAERVSQWICVPTPGARGLAAGELAGRVAAVVPAQRVAAVETVTEGLNRAAELVRGQARREGGGILAFGSFSLVEQGRDLLTAGLRGAMPSTPPAPDGCEPNRAMDLEN
jgi:dihydrofolate synthase/folylpolyglutamate synthase